MTTSYIVLRSVDPGRYEFVGAEDAGTREAAAKTVAEKIGKEGDYYPVPARSFEAVPVSLETYSRAVLGRKVELEDRSGVEVA